LRDAALQFGKGGLDVLRAEVDEAEEAVRVFREDSQDLVVLLAELLRRRIEGPAHPHVDAEALDAHAVGDGEEVSGALLRRGLRQRRAGEVAVEVPDAHGRRGGGATVEGAKLKSKRWKKAARCAVKGGIPDSLLLYSFASFILASEFQLLAPHL